MKLNKKELDKVGMKKAVVYGVFVALFVMMFGTLNLAAQSDSDSEKIRPFIGHWNIFSTNVEGEDRGNCGGRLGDAGEKALNCSLPVDQLPLNKRGEAWLKFIDQRNSPTIAECAQVSLPSVLTSDTYISGFPDRLLIQHTDPSGLINRNAWKDGSGPTPIPGELFQHGFSTYHMDGDDLVVMTDHFTFDPDGIDDHLHMASSVRKKVTQRYHLIDGNTMRLIITLEDPLFLTRPFKFAYVFDKKPGGPNPNYRDCDTEVSREEIISGYPGNKYDETDYK
jgi:hypothetical protein